MRKLRENLKQLRYILKNLHAKEMLIRSIFENINYENGERI